MNCTLLNIPNFCSSYYLLGLSKHLRLQYSGKGEFSRFDFRPLAIMEIGGKLVVVDNSDPVGVDAGLLAQADLYFATNKLSDSPNYAHDKIIPLAPHYPVNSASVFLKVFWTRLFGKEGKEVAKELYRLQKRPQFQIEQENRVEGNSLFFAGSIWKKEMEANQLRYSFIKACQKHPGVDFEGGFLPRDDGDNLGFDDALAPRRYPPREFMDLSRKSLFGFNNAAVLGAISWRVAEYLNIGIPIVSLPFRIELPEYPAHGEQIHMIAEIGEIPEFLDFAVANHDYLNKLSKGGKRFFVEHCLPEVQAKRILAYL
ncbi:glycosyltransferase family 1 protein [Algoriphagus sp. H41]|uniref:Glycosyltransferase family 1 protein n=1 Tax=Algoriphagus oliviformis TaxID=2811231 RepID=A0ABS3C9S6_9BACT|nr:glycosyltransferase [Algoriphagus oliviformis]MBN7812920.1 glycosyltransferase family 1 protein [Algoriphagus oliviformis]